MQALWGESFLEKVTLQCGYRYCERLWESGKGSDSALFPRKDTVHPWVTEVTT